MQLVILSAQLLPHIAKNYNWIDMYMSRRVDVYDRELQWTYLRMIESALKLTIKESYLSL